MWRFDREVLSILLMVIGFSSAVCFGSEISPFEPLAGPVPNQKTCPGLYCGRKLLLDSQDNFTYSSCGACDRSERPNNSSICIPCNGTPDLYDWMYLGFMVLVSLTLHIFFIDYFSDGKSKAMTLHISATLECTVSSIVTLLVLDPVGSPKLRSCDVSELSDWYTMLENPQPQYTSTLHCTQEAVYPLYTAVFIYYSIHLVLMMLVRPGLSIKFSDNLGRSSIYAALYFIPILTVMHAVFAGLIYYSYPYLTLIISLVTHAVHFAKEEIETPRLLISKKRNPVILFIHWLMHAYGIIALTRLQNPVIYGPMLACIPFPAIFYIVTARFADPSQLLAT
ncbi:JNK1/MAPK8-associated membrane protein-like [Lytechinus variegatus]|uniref:JNK1/MAPK8-associated membrane protein-like n=1 Tax=Lytechinus variegatus TaxID=7654 RepID=UPI001BB1406F|nr:JNK1/MAPK8-associated membrane protein-like [Lytechinus variegatus]